RTPAPLRPAVTGGARYRDPIMANPFKERMQRGEVVVVVNPDHPSPSLTEFVAGLGVDGVFIDCEHGMATVERVQEMCRAARVAGVQAIVRPESNADYLITRYLDAGANGVMVPHVDTADAARAIVRAVRYARPRDHADKVVIAMIESLTAVSNLADILGVEGVDVFFIGPRSRRWSSGRWPPSAPPGRFPEPWSCARPRPNSSPRAASISTNMLTISCAPAPTISAGG